MWEAAGVSPDAVVGHSQGEIAAAVVAGILSLDDAAKVVALRSRTLTALAGRGGMLSIAEPVEGVRARIASYGTRLSVAAVNGPASTVVSGDADALRELADSCGESPRARMIPVDYASHSAHVDELKEEILAVLHGIAPGEGRIPMVSSTTGAQLRGPELVPDYWYDSLRETVEFDRAVHALAVSGHGVYIEVSPHPVLAPAITDSLEAYGPVVADTLRRDDGGAGRLLLSLAQAYTRGVPVDWTALLPAGSGDGSVELPTYAFQHRRYWPVFPERAPRQTVADWRYRVEWQPFDGPSGVVPSGTWLLVTGRAEAETAGGVAGALTACGVDVRVLETGAADRATLGNVLRGVGEVAGVVSLLALDENPLPGRPRVPAGLAATSALLQAMLDAGPVVPLWVLTRGAVAALPGEIPSLAQAQVWAWGQTAGLEQAKQWGGLVDLPAEFDAAAGDRLAGLLAGGPQAQDQVALRASGPLGRRLVRAPRPTAGPAGPWRTGGTALITGGTGLIGGRTARLMAERGTPRVVLAGRSGPAAAGVPALVAELATRGSAVEVVACDVAERPAVGALLDRISATGPALSAVVHSAGTGHGAPVTELTDAGLQTVCEVKVGGALHLHELAAERGLELDAFVLFSSGAATWGSGLLSGYGAANAALDALAERRRAAGLAATSVAWGLWGGGGMGAGEAGEQLSAYGLRTMAPEHGIEGLAQALDDGATQLVVADVDWERFVPLYTLHRPSPLLSALPDALRVLEKNGAYDTEDGLADDEATGSQRSAAAARLSARLGGARSTREREAVLLEVVREHAAAALGHPDAEAVDPDATFLEQGFTSLSALELRNRLAAATGLRLSGPLVFDHPTPALTASYLRERLAGDPAPPDGGPERTAPRFVLTAAPETARPETGTGPERTGGAEAPASEAPASETLAALYLRANRLGRGADAVRMIAGLARFRPSFAGTDELEGIPPLVPLTRRHPGTAAPTLVCLPSFGAGDAQEFVRLVQGLRSPRHVLSAVIPGYTAGEPLAADPDALLDLCTRTLLAAPETAAEAGPFVLVGYSSGGLVAQALAARLADLGRGPAAMVLLDSFAPQSAGAPDEILGTLPAAVLLGNPGGVDAGGIGGDSWLTALAHYYGHDWRDHVPYDARLPTLMIRHGGEPGSPEGADGAVDLPWGYSGNLTSVTVPGDHFTMIGSHAGTTAQAVEAWLDAHVGATAGATTTSTEDNNDD
ncbi:type I polyketide synthase [Streptomyces sp. NPDC001770]